MDADVDALSKKASALRLAGDYRGALDAFVELDRYYRKQESYDISMRALNLNRSASLALRFGNYVIAEQASRKCLTLYRGASVVNDEILATSVYMLSAVLAEMGRFDEATVLAEEAVEIFTRVFGAEHRFVKDRLRDLERMRGRVGGLYLDQPRKKGM